MCPFKHLTNHVEWEDQIRVFFVKLPSFFSIHMGFQSAIYLKSLSWEFDWVNHKVEREIIAICFFLQHAKIQKQMSWMGSSELMFPEIIPSALQLLVLLHEMLFNLFSNASKLDSMGDPIQWYAWTSIQSFRYHVEKLVYQINGLMNANMKGIRRLRFWCFQEDTSNPRNRSN